MEIILNLKGYMSSTCVFDLKKSVRKRLDRTVYDEGWTSRFIATAVSEAMNVLPTQ
jgi:hypothetical protein